MVLSLTAATNSFTISGWTHICVVYNSNLPSLYINGELVATGLKSAYTVHPDVGTLDATTKMINRFEGDIAGLTVLSSALSVVQSSQKVFQLLPPHIRQLSFLQIKFCCARTANTSFHLCCSIRPLVPNQLHRCL